MDGFIVLANDSKGKSIYVSNTSPILWTGEKLNAKVFDSFKNCKNELEDNFISLSVTISYTDISDIYIVEYSNDIEQRREKFL